MIQLWFGTGSAEKQVAINAAFQKAADNAPGLDKEVADSFIDGDALMAFLGNRNLFSEKRFVILQNLVANNDLAGFISENLERIGAMSGIDIIFSEGELDKRGKFYKAFADRKLMREFKIAEGEMARKLALPTVDFRESFALVNYLLRGERARYLEIIERTKQAAFGGQDEAFRLFGLITTQLMQFLAIKLADGRPLTAVAKSLGMKSDYPLKQMASAGRDLTKNDAMKLVKLASQLDKKVKLSQLTIWQAVMRLSI